MGAEFLRVFPAEREWIGWIYAASDHAYQRLIVVRLWFLHLLKLQHIGRAVFVGDYGPHLWLFVRVRCANAQGYESCQAQKNRTNRGNCMTHVRARSVAARTTV